MKKVCVFIGILCCMFFAQNGAFALNPTAMYNSTVDSILYIETQNGSGSGVIIEEDGTFVTCFHVIASADYINVKGKNGSKYKVNGYKYIDPDNDIAILTLATSKKFKPIKGYNQDIKIGDEVYTIANPKGLKFVFSDGMINQFDEKNIQFSAPVSRGSSGGALLNSSGELIGIISSQYDPSRTQNLNFATPVKYFINDLEHRKKLNSKKMIWSDFLLSRASKEQFISYMRFVNSTGENGLLYRYTKPVAGRENVHENDYAAWGGLAIIAFIENPENYYYDEAFKWFNLSLSCNKNVELSAYSLAMLSKVDAAKDLQSLYLGILENYPKSYKNFVNNLSELEKCFNDKNSSCKEMFLANIFTYNGALYRNTYNDNWDFTPETATIEVSDKIFALNQKIKGKSKKKIEIRDNLINEYLERAQILEKQKEWGKVANDYRSALYFAKYYCYMMTIPAVDENLINEITLKLENSYKHLKFDKSAKSRFQTGIILMLAHEYAAAGYEFSQAALDKEYRLEALSKAYDAFTKVK